MIHFLAQVAQTQSPFEWASQHIHVIGWGTVVVAAWKIASFFAEAKAQVTKTVTQIDTLSTNHFPHIQDGILELVELGKANNEKLDKLTDVLRG